MQTSKILSLAAVALVCSAGCRSSESSPSVVSVLSPDGRNEIRLHEAPLRVEALRDGVRLVAPTRIGLTVDGRPLAATGRHKSLTDRSGRGRAASPVYKKASVDLSRGETFADFGDWGVALVARNDGVAYRFETKLPGEITVGDECCDLALPDPNARCWYHVGDVYGREEKLAETKRAKDIRTPKGYVYLPFTYETGGKSVSVTESDVCDYPILNFKAEGSEAGVRFRTDLARWPKTTERVGGWGKEHNLATGGRWVKILEHDGFLVKTAGTRTFPWRTFVFADRPSDLPAADIVWALARPPAAGDDFGWVKPGKVAWDWWNCFDNQGDQGCNTKTYERFIDFAAKTGVEYVIFDEGWSESLNIWKFHKNVDVPHLIDYANRKGVGIILWMAWAQVCGEEERVASHFAKLGAKGFKVDFMDRGDADVERFLWKFAEACRKNRMLVDYHGAHRPTGMSRAYPNVLNYEGIHGLECMKWFANQYDFLANDVRECFLRMVAGPMDYTPGAMDNYPNGRYPKRTDKNVSSDRTYTNPGSLGTRARQMAMMALFEAPLQMLCDSPTKYEKNMECFRFMAATPVVWEDTVALGGTPETYIALARKAKDGAWYVACLSNADARTVEFDTSFLGSGTWKAEVFRDAADAAAVPTRYVHETVAVTAGAKQKVTLAPGGGFVMRISK